MHIHIFLVFRSCTDIRFPEAQWSPEYIIETPTGPYLDIKDKYSIITNLHFSMHMQIS